MDLRTTLLRVAAGRPHVLVIGGLGTDGLRARVEHDVARRRWPFATAPADADVLVTVGRPGAELAAVVDDVWASVPAPRARVRITIGDEVVAALDRAAEVLRDLHTQRAEAPRDGLSAGQADPPTGQDEHGGGHHHHGGGMELPGGLAMADLGDDRDGLALDRLHVVLGPVLPEWPSGLVVDVVLQGDVVQEARSRFLDLDVGDTVDERTPAVRDLTSVARVLALAGWAGPATQARDLRDTVLFGEGDTARVLEELDALHRRVRRSRLLRWMLRSSAAGRSEVLEALDERLRSARASITGAEAEPAAAVDLPALDDRLTGAEFAAARLIVAAADPMPQPVTARSTTGDGAS